MNDCRRTAERLAPYADEALSPSERQEVEHHLEACPPCRASADRERAGRAVLRHRAAQLREAPLPPGLRTRCAALAQEHRTHAPAAGRWTMRLLPASLSAALVLFTAFAIFTLATQRSNTVLAAQLGADHDRCFRRIAPPATGLNAEAEETRLADTYGWDVHIPPTSADDGIKLVGARRCLLSHGGVPHLLYDAGGQQVSLYVFEGVTRTAGDAAAFGHRARVWTRGPTTFVLVSTGGAGDLTRAVRYLQQDGH
jgi:anti-sigma factor RsiW